MRTNVITMTILLILLILAQVSGEWVEISQQHYRKPLRIHSINNPFTITDEIEFEDITESLTDKASSFSDFNWTKATDNEYITDEEQPQLYANVKQDDKAVDRDAEQRDLEEKGYEIKSNHGPPKLTGEYGKTSKQKAIIERVSSKGNIKRVELKDNLVKSPVINNKNEKIRNRYEEYPLVNEQDAFEDKNKIFTEINNRRIYLNQDHTKLSSTLPSLLNDNSYIEEIYLKRPKQQYRNQSVVETTLIPTPPFTAEKDDSPGIAELKDIYMISKHLFTTESTNFYDDNVTKSNYNITKYITKQPNKNINAENNRYVIEENERQLVKKISSAESNNKPSERDNQQTTNKKNNPTSVKENNLETEIQGLKEDIVEKTKEHKKINENEPETKVNNMENLLKFLKAVTDTISQNSRRNFSGKMRYLHELKTTILANIAERIDATWPDDVISSPHRSARSTKASPRGHHLQFPSSESALMSISFLTFAVFLIKLVLQLIQTYKHKAMLVAPVMVASAGRTTPTHRKRD